MFQRRRSVWISLAVVTGFAALLANPVEAQVTPGVRAGLSLGPHDFDQFYFGGHIETSPLVERTHFRPNIEIGLGDDVTIVALNFEFVYRFPSRRPWHVFAGAGPALNVFDFEGGTETEGGFNFLIGAEHRDGLFFEFKIGVADSPDVKFGVGWAFH